MARVDLEIAQSQRLIESLTERLARQKQLLQGMEVGRLFNFGLEGDGGRQARDAYEEQLAHKRDIVRNLERMLESEKQRLRRLEEQLNRRPGAGRR